MSACRTDAGLLIVHYTRGLEVLVAHVHPSRVCDCVEVCYDYPHVGLLMRRATSYCPCSGTGEAPWPALTVEGGSVTPEQLGSLMRAERLLASSERAAR